MTEGAFISEARGLMASLEGEPAHATHVARLAVTLFDATQDQHQLTASHRLILEMAACLHDIGWSAAPSGKGHHKASARLILDYPWKCGEPRAVSLVAQIARYHRKSIPNPGHAEFAALNVEDRRIVEVLAGLLRIADGLDRGHLQRVTHLRVLARANAFVIEISGLGPLDVELQGASRKAELAQIVFCKPFEFQQSPGPAHLPCLSPLWGE